jgi:hypothetical protein
MHCKNGRCLMEEKENKKGKEQTENGIGRRAFLKVVGVTALGVQAYGLPVFAKSKKAPDVKPDPQIENYKRCRIVVFGVDGLRIDYAKRLRDEGASALNELNPPICAACGGLSAAQPAWASIWSALPSQKIKCWSNKRYKAMPEGYHIIEKLAHPEAYGENLYIIWITAKNQNIRGLEEESPHHAVYKLIKEGKNPGIYLGDEKRTDEEVRKAARDALKELNYQNPDNFICFIHFRNPGYTGTQVAGEPNDFEKYLNKARLVDKKIYQLMKDLPQDTDIIYCSEQGFDFKSQGDPRDGHGFSPLGMLATNLPTLKITNVSQMAIGRLIYKRAGFDPDFTSRADGKLYKMFGEDLI